MQYETVDAFDRLHGQLQGLTGVTWTRASTVAIHEPITGKSLVFTMQTARDSERGDTVFITVVSGEDKAKRIYLPAKVAKIVASQRDSLTTKTRSAAGKANAQARKDAGLLPGFMKGKKK